MPLCGGGKTVQRKLVLLCVVALLCSNEDNANWCPLLEATVHVGRHRFSMSSLEGKELRLCLETAEC